MDLNNLAREITLKEAGRYQMTIAQVKEVIRLLGEQLANQSAKETASFLNKYSKKVEWVVEDAE